MRLKRFALALWMVLAVGAVFAQDATAPISTLEAGDFRALAVTHGGERLLVADAENALVRIYDFRDPANPQRLPSLELSGTPVLLAGGDGFGLVAELTDGDTDVVEVVAPTFPRQPYQPVNILDILKNPRVLALSPDSHWGIVVSDGGYTLLQIDDPNNILSLPVNDPLVSAALTNTTAYLLRDDALETAPLETGDPLRSEQSLALDGTPSLIALNNRASAGVVVLDENRLLFFNPDTLEPTGERTLDGGAITSIQYVMQGENQQALLVTQAGTAAVQVIDTTESQSIAAPSTMQALANPVRAVAAYQNFIIATDGVTISIYSTTTP